MFKRQTLFILGAGASVEAGLPAGKALAQAIGKKMDIRFQLGNRQVGAGDMELYVQMTSQLRRDVPQYQNAGWLIRDGIGLAQCIDDFLDQHRTNAHLNLYGKAAIVKSILEAERASKLYFRDVSGIERLDTDRVADTWFVKFVHMLGRGIPKEDAREIFDRVSFITFNYDRCVEHFLRLALQRLYGIRDQEAADIVSDLHIIHPYGVVGDAPFGNTNANCVALAGGIKTYTEQIADAQMSAQLAGEIFRAEHIVFLGFAYHDQNMEVLRPPKPMAAAKRLFGTAHGMSDSDVDVVGHQIDAWFEGRNGTAYRSSMIKIENKLKCADLFDHYAKSLTGG
jgi:hypothetical protein